MNLVLTVIQYLFPVLVLMVAALTAVFFPRLGGGLHGMLSLVILVRFRTPAGLVLIALPLAVLGSLYWFGKVQPRKWALFAILCLPIAMMLVCGAVPAYRVYQRVDDGYRGMRTVEGNKVRLRWAPAGPGWPERGGNWYKAQHSCAYLSSDGTQVADQPQGIWRLPTAEELVRSMTLYGRNAGGFWDAARGVPNFQLTPDKESPLWNPYSLIIYWWTATEFNEQQAYLFSYNGHEIPSLKKAGAELYGFRCVADP
jgi:hypothetical protein